MAIKHPHPFRPTGVDRKMYSIIIKPRKTSEFVHMKEFDDIRLNSRRSSAGNNIETNFRQRN